MREYEGGGITFRPAVESDLHLLADIENRSFHHLDRFSRRNIGHYIRNPHRSIIVDVIESGSRAIGYSVFLTRRNSRAISLHSICIVPEMQGKGAARTYLERRIRAFIGAYDRVILRVRMRNSAARDLYLSLGFEIDGVEDGYYPDGEDAFRMIKELH